MKFHEGQKFVRFQQTFTVLFPQEDGAFGIHHSETNQPGNEHKTFIARDNLEEYWTEKKVPPVPRGYEEILNGLRISDEGYTLDLTTFGARVFIKNRDLIGFNIDLSHLQDGMNWVKEVHYNG